VFSAGVLDGAFDAPACDVSGAPNQGTACVP
jgi:hypothetical protein